MKRIGLALAAVALATGLSISVLGAPASPRETMHRVFEAVVVLLPLSLDAKRFAAPENQEAVSQAINALAGGAWELENHGAGRDRSFAFLSRSLASDVEEIRQRYAFERLEESRFFVLEATRNCVACHERLPSPRDFPLAARLLDQIDMQSLSHHERSQLYVVTRQFEKALETWEELFGEWIVSPGQLDAGGYLRDYLTVALRVEGSYERARRNLEKLQQRANVPDYLKPQIAAWVRDLERFEKKPPAAGDLASVRAIVDAAPAGDAESLVADLVASGVLLRMLDERAGSSRTEEAEKTLAEIYYLLGRVEARSVESFWVPQAPFHLELSVRLDPTGANAARALALYEEQLAIGYGGLSADDLPVDLWTTLQELRGLVQPAS